MDGGRLFPRLTPGERRGQGHRALMRRAVATKGLAPLGGGKKAVMRRDVHNLRVEERIRPPSLRRQVHGRVGSATPAGCGWRARRNGRHIGTSGVGIGVGISVGVGVGVGVGFGVGVGVGAIACPLRGGGLGGSRRIQINVGDGVRVGQAERLLLLLSRRRGGARQRGGRLRLLLQPGHSLVDRGLDRRLRVGCLATLRER